MIYFILFQVLLGAGISVTVASDKTAPSRPLCALMYDVGSTITRVEAFCQEGNEWQHQFSLSERLSTYHLNDTTFASADAQFQKVRDDAYALLPREANVIERGVGTAGLRGSGDWGEQFAANRKLSGIDFQIISQDEEAMVGLKAAKQKSPNATHEGPFCIFDIGGGSSQLLCEDEGQIVIAGSEISVRNIKHFLEEATCPTPHDLDCHLFSLLNALKMEVEFYNPKTGAAFEVFPKNALESIGKIVRKQGFIFGLGPVHESFALKGLKEQGMLHEAATTYTCELLRQSMNHENQEKLNKSIIICLILNLLDLDVVEVIPNVNNAWGLMDFDNSK
jgi:hypothetical protein